MKRLFFALAMITLLLDGTVARAQSSQDRTITIENAWARLSPSEAGTINVFFDIVSNADKPDVLLTASSPVAEKALLRRGKWKGLDFFNSRQASVAIKAYKRTEFKPGVLEITLSDLTGPVKVGSTVPVTLVFKEAGPVEIAPSIGNQLLGNRLKK